METGAYRHTDPGTSEEAALSVDATRLEEEFMKALRQYPGGLTTEEISSLTGIRLASVTPRAAPLVRKGKIYNSGRKERGESGRARIVWKANGI